MNLLDLPRTRPRVLGRYHIMVPRGSMEECRCLGSYLVGQAPIHCFSPRVGFDYLRQMVENVSLALEVENGGAAGAFFFSLAIELWIFFFLPTVNGPPHPTTINFAPCRQQNTFPIVTQRHNCCRKTIRHNGCRL